MAVSPFYWTPELPVDAFNIWPLVTLTEISLILFIIGGVGFISRDIRQN